jgi:DNA-binding PadR family transcriptional regulator
LALSNKEVLLLELLEPMVYEHYGFDLADRSNGEIARGSVHVYLSKLKDKGYVTSRKEETDSKYPRSMYRLTEAGKRARIDAEGMSRPKGRWVLSCQ